MMKHAASTRHCVARLWGPLLLLALVGCQAPAERMMEFGAVRTSVTIRDSADETLSWTELIVRTDEADVIVLGELHDDHVAHLVQRAVVQGCGRPPAQAR